MRDLEKMAIVHNFVWTDSELAHMISCFDTDGDGKVSPSIPCHPDPLWLLLQILLPSYCARNYCKYLSVDPLTF